METVLLDSHVVHWWMSEPDRLSASAANAVGAAERTCVADVTWWELAQMAVRKRIELRIPMAIWLNRIERTVRTVPLSRSIAERAVSLPASFPRDPFDRIIYSTAVEHGWRLVTKDRGIRDFPQEQPVTLW